MFKGEKRYCYLETQIKVAGRDRVQRVVCKKENHIYKKKVFKTWVHCMSKGVFVNDGNPQE